jgi:hypothetical protein
MGVRRVPWWGGGVVNFISENIQPTDTVFEYGSGGSTLWFAERAKSVVSVEHDWKWYRTVRREALENVNIIYAPPDETFYSEYFSESYSTDGERSFRDYVSTIDEFDEFDWVIVDGRARNQCIKHSMDKFRKFILSSETLPSGQG